MSMRSSASVTLGPASSRTPRIRRESTPGRKPSAWTKGPSTWVSASAGTATNRAKRSLAWAASTFGISSPNKASARASEQRQREGLEHRCHGHAGRSRHLGADQRPHRGGEDDKHVLEEDDRGEEALLVAVQALQGLGAAAAALRQVADADAVGADDGDLDAVDDGVAEDRRDEDDEPEGDVHVLAVSFQLSASYSACVRNLIAEG